MSLRKDDREVQLSTHKFNAASDTFKFSRYYTANTNTLLFSLVTPRWAPIFTQDAEQQAGIATKYGVHLFLVCF